MVYYAVYDSDPRQHTYVSLSVYYTLYCLLELFHRLIPYSIVSVSVVTVVVSGGRNVMWSVSIDYCCVQHMVRVRCALFFCVADDAWPNRIKSPMKFDVIPWCEKLVDSCYIKFLRRFDLPKVYLFFAPQNTKITKQPSWAQALPKTTFVHIYSKIHYTHADLAMTVQ